ncbi:MAG: DNA-directed RNA polymerase subunit beta, partial [Deltaproteobacteria bacterium]|nr:DNA-directed RNA polymerase subunit beta [Deltaproteobacteria bacterium]
MKRVRKSFAKIGELIEKPHLIDMQRLSYEKFLQTDIDPDQRGNFGLHGIFKNIFPIVDFNELCSLEYVRYNFGEPKYSVAECTQRGMTYEASVKITVRLITYDVDPDTEVKSIRDIKEQSVYLGNIPLMTKAGVFIINGTERVIVSQLQRSPGLFFAHDSGKNNSLGKRLYSARLIPVRGSWIDLDFDAKDILYVRIDRRRKFPSTILLKALGADSPLFRDLVGDINPEEVDISEILLRFFYETERVFVDGQTISKQFNAKLAVGQRAENDILHPETGEILAKKNRKIGKSLAARLVEAGVERLETEAENIIGSFTAHDVVDPATGEVILLCNTEVTEDALAAIGETAIPSFEVLYIDGIKISDSFRKTLALDKVNTQEDALLDIYRRLRPSSPPTIAEAIKFFDNMFFNPGTYDLSVVGRFKINSKLDKATDSNQLILDKEDIILSIRAIIRLNDAQGPVDDIDHLGNRRVRTVGELIENQYRVGLVRMERAIKERMSLQEVETLMPHDLINPKPITSAIKEFFCSSQLSQFMDQTNPLSEVTHKRRLSALGPGGLSRERAGFEVRDVHTTHYGRICPVETPEGPNIGLIVSLATFAKINKYGFIETAYRKVNDRKVTDEVAYMSALDEQGLLIAPAQADIGSDGLIKKDMLLARQDGEVYNSKAEDITHMDVSPNQLVSVGASLIPFLENDDANRALMGSNMQRQGVPLLRTTAPLVGTGIEKLVAHDSGACLLAAGDGVIEEVDSSRIVVRYDEPGTDGFSAGVGIYRLDKYRKSNQNTCFNQRPLVLPGQRVKQDDVLADGPATEMGELALGRNPTIAFMPWRGYNFEDAVLINERLIKDDTYTSLHIEAFETVARDTKLGKEEITRDIPNVGEEALRNLDESGIVRVGAVVKAGDTLVGKVTPKGETQLSPEEKLLRAIFGEKAGDVKDTSLRVPPGIEGVVINAQVYARKGVEKDERTRAIEEMEIAKLEQDMGDEVHYIRKGVRKSLADILLGHKAQADIVGPEAEVILAKGKKITAAVLAKLRFNAIKAIKFAGQDKLGGEIDLIYGRCESQIKSVKKGYETRIERLRKGDDLPPGVIKMVKVYVAKKRKLSVGDKMAGRHGNKGVVSRILPEEDMPYFADGTTVDIVLNPLGVPSRMNVGQVLEVHLGLAARKLGEQLCELGQRDDMKAMRAKMQKIYSKAEYKELTDGVDDSDLRAMAKKMKTGIHISTPVFDGAKEIEIRDLLKEAGMSDVGQCELYDGLTGEKFENPITVGTMYYLKLHHLVDDKIHTRSTGPYSLVTQQPLGGKAQFGGQRLGEMEVWAMEAYGAAYTLQEFLTVKSDDVTGRTKMYEKIVKGNNFIESGLPESFHVLVKELQGLCLDMELINE